MNISRYIIVVFVINTFNDDRLKNLCKNDKKKIKPTLVLHTDDKLTIGCWIHLFIPIHL